MTRMAILMYGAGLILGLGAEKIVGYFWGTPQQYLEKICICGFLSATGFAFLVGGMLGISISIWKWRWYN